MRRSVTRYGEHFYGASLLFGFLACARTFFNAPSLNLLVYIMSSVYLWGKKIRAYFFFFFTSPTGVKFWLSLVRVFVSYNVFFTRIFRLQCIELQSKLHCCLEEVFLCARRVKIASFGRLVA